MSNRIEVDSSALYKLLQALSGPDHYIRELQYTRNIGRLTGDHPILILQDEYNAWAAEQNKEQKT